jgi:hypothetical protein
VGLVVAVPTAKGLVAGVGEKKFQRRRFNVAVANPNGIESFSPALADEIGLRRVIGENRKTLKGLNQLARTDATPLGLDIL